MIDKEQIKKWAREVGTPYVNRHYPDVTHFGFGVDSLQAFAELAYNEALEHCARLSEGHYGDGHRLAEIIRTYKETP